MRFAWRPVRWGAFLIALGVDGVIFYLADPPSALSFIASGFGALMLFVILVGLASLIRGKRHIKGALHEGEKLAHQAGQHWLHLVWNIAGHRRRDIQPDRIALYTIGIPVLIMFVALLFFAVWSVWFLCSQFAWSAGWVAWLSPLYTLLPDNRIVIASCIPLLIAIPFAIQHVAEWSAHQYVITPYRIIVRWGVFDRNQQAINLSRVSDIRFNLRWYQRLPLLRYGNIIFVETAGVQETLVCVNGPEAFEKKASVYVHSASTAADERLKE